MIRDDPIHHPPSDHGVWNVNFAAVDKPRDDISSSVEFRHDTELIAIEDALDERGWASQPWHPA
jgi:hypothetical protein